VEAVAVTNFDIVTPEQIASGAATDAYFDRTVQVLEAAGRNPHVVAEVSADQFATGSFELFAGVTDAAALLEGLAVDVWALPEGTLFDGGPVMRIEGRYLDFARYETALLGFLSHASGIATNAMRARRAAPNTTLLSFGARHVHPSMAAVVERSALLGGLDGFSHVAAGEVLDREASGTMPHTLMICFGRDNQAAAWRAYDDVVPEAAPRVALCDTYSDEVEEVLLAVETLGEDLDSVRLDTTASRRGDFERIVREVRWELDARGHESVDIFASGGLGPADLQALSDHVSGFGVGGFVSNADPVDFALDLVEVEGEPAAKRGKLSGAKEVYRTPDGGHHVALADRVGPSGGTALMERIIEDGSIVTEFDLDAAIDRANRDVERVEPAIDPDG
jgi:nicotinate phosphoribosyltransferase